jgi:hypothetical protein
VSDPGAGRADMAGLLGMMPLAAQVTQTQAVLGGEA